MADADKEVDLKAIWAEMLTGDLIANLSQTCKNNKSTHSIRAKVLLKVTFAELRDRIQEASIATKKLEEERVKNEVLQIDHNSTKLELSKAQQKLKELEEENKRLKEKSLKRLSDERQNLEQKKPKVGDADKTFFVPDTNLDLLSPQNRPNVIIPESLSQDEFLLKTPPKGNQSCETDESSPQSSPIITAIRRSSSALSNKTASPAPLSPHNSQINHTTQAQTSKSQHKKRSSKLALKMPPKKQNETVESDATFFEEEQFKLFDSPETEKKKLKELLGEDNVETPLGFYKGEVVRKKEDRQKLPGWECHECQKFYEVFCEDMSTQDKRTLINKCSKHRQGRPVVGNTPKGLWDFGLIQSPKAGTTQKCKLNTKKTKGQRLLDKAQAIEVEEDLDWAN